MKSTYYLLIIVFSCALLTAKSQTLYIYTQQQMNLLAGYTTYPGGVVIHNDSTTAINDRITDISVMSSLINASSVQIEGTYITELNALDNVKSGSIHIYNNKLLKGGNYLKSFQTGGIFIEGNDAIDTLTGFEEFKSGIIEIKKNSGLKHINFTYYIPDEVETRVRENNKLESISITDKNGAKNIYSILFEDNLKIVNFSEADSIGMLGIGGNLTIPMNNFNGVYGVDKLTYLKTLDFFNLPNLQNICSIALPYQNGSLTIEDGYFGLTPIISSLQDLLTLDCSNYTGIEEANYKGFQVYPNPVASGEAVQLEAPFTGTVFNSMGQSMFQLKNEQSFSTAGLGAGLYVLRSASGETSKLVVSDNGK